MISRKIYHFSDCLKITIICSGTWSWLIKGIQSQIQSPLGTKRENKENEKTDKLPSLNFAKKKKKKAEVTY